MRHIDVAQLWIQEKVANGTITVVKVSTHYNLADILTKHVDRRTLDKQLVNMGFMRANGRHEIMPSLNAVRKQDNKKPVE